MLPFPSSWRGLSWSAGYRRTIARAAASTGMLLMCSLLAGGCSDSPKERVAALLGEKCTLNSDCKEKDYVCAFGRCHEQCLATRDCPRPGRCVRSEKSDVHVCQLKDEATCDDDADEPCQNGQICAGDGSCRDECKKDSDCLKEQTCVKEALVCVDEGEPPPPVSPEGGASGAGGRDGNGGEGGSGDNARGGETGAEEGGAPSGGKTHAAGGASSGGAGGAGTAEAGMAGAGGANAGETLRITPKGGTYEGEGVTLIVPAGAVSAPTEVTVRVVVDPKISLPDGWWPRGDVYQLSPQDLVFDKDVTIWVPHDEKDTDNLIVAWLGADADEWQELPADFTSEPGYAVVENAELGWYTVVSKFDCQQCSETQTCEHNHCYEACDTQTPCSGGATCCQVNGHGICIDTRTDPDNCGACGAPCRTADHAEELSCSLGVCLVKTCEEDYEDCDADPLNGCEANLTSDRLHCSGCGHACGAGSECSDGACDKGLSEIVAGDNSTCVLRENGAVVCWGAVAVGTDRYRPQVVSGVADAVAVGVASAGTERAYAVLSTGQVLSWQANAAQWETPTVETVSGVTDMGGGNGFQCALRSVGQVSCWGSTNTSGELGNSTNDPSPTSPVAVTGLSDAVQLSVGYGHSCARREGGEVVCWGANADGRLGDGSTVSANAPRTVQLIDDFIDVSSGEAHSCGLRAGGQVHCWGRNTNGVLGVAGSSSDVPVLVDGLEDVASVRAGHYHTCALHTDGTVSCWGYNLYGQLGDGTTDQPATAGPRKVPGLTDVVMLTAGSAHNCVLRKSGPPLCWGYNVYGQLGAGTTNPHPSPTPVVDLP